jgi:hypothetical protein
LKIPSLPEHYRARATLMVLLLATVALPTASSSLPVLEDADAYAVYSVALAAYSKPPSSRTLILQRETTRRDETECVKKAPTLPDGWQPVLADYRRQNRTVWQLVEGMSFSEPYVLASSTGLEAFNRQDSWPLFRATYADAEHYFILSAVGFDEKKTRALIFVIQHGGPENSEGRVRLLERGEHGWKELQAGIHCGFIT